MGTTVRERLERDEDIRLSSHAVRAAHTRGRVRPVIPCDLRTEFQRDRDRVIHCKSFRRLKYKTQCFLPDVGDHVRTRLTHTLEVSQIARTIARVLCLNEDLTEAIALAHDLGHTCFGHMGERTLDLLSRDEGGFRHNEQSLRVIETLENDGSGLNLTWEVRDGVLNHCSDGNPSTLEGQIVSLADRIAYINHDIDDAIRAGVLIESDIPKYLTDMLGDSHGRRIDSMIRDIASFSEEKPYVRMSMGMFDAMNEIRAFLFERVYRREDAYREEEKAKRIIEALYRYYLDNPHNLSVIKDGLETGIHTAIKDHIAGMTDRYAVREFRNIFLPKPYLME